MEAIAALHSKQLAFDIQLDSMLKPNILKQQTASHQAPIPETTRPQLITYLPPTRDCRIWSDSINDPASFGSRS